MLFKPETIDQRLYTPIPKDKAKIRTINDVEKLSHDPCMIKRKVTNKAMKSINDKKKDFYYEKNGCSLSATQ